MSVINSSLLDRRAIIKAFNQAAHRYNAAAILQREVATRLFERLDLMNIQPQVILESGARSGYLSELLIQRYPHAQVFAMDWSSNLLSQSVTPRKVCAEPEKLPFLSGTVDLLISNLLWHWMDDNWLGLQEWHRVLKPGGLLLFSTLGPDTLSELQNSFAQVDTHPHVHPFHDMHDIGDALLAAQFVEPVMDSEHLHLTYASISRLIQDLRDTGVTNAAQGRCRGLYGKNNWRRMLNHYQNFHSKDQRLLATFEIVYGLGWAPAAPLSYKAANGDIIIPVGKRGLLRT